eukprot:4818_1
MADSENKKEIKDTSAKMEQFSLEDLAPEPEENIEEPQKKKTKPNPECEDEETPATVETNVVVKEEVTPKTEETKVVVEREIKAEDAHNSAAMFEGELPGKPITTDVFDPRVQRI